MRSSTLPAAAAATDSLVGFLARGAATVERRRWWIVGLCVVGQWAVVGALSQQAQHNGWIYQHGDDGPWYWTSAWALTTLHIPYSAVSLGWPYLLTPFAAIFGPDMAQGLPAVVAFNQLVLAPACVVGMYLIGERVAGRLFGVWTAFLWVALPVISLLLYASHARHVVVDSFIPTATGLNAVSDFPSTACAIASGLLLLRAGESNHWRDAALCGVVLGFLMLVKPSNAPMLLVAAGALLAARRLRGLLVAAAAAVPSVLALAIWKRTGRTDAFVSAPAGGGQPHPGPAPPPGTAAHRHGLFAHVTDIWNRFLHLPQHYVAFDAHRVGQNISTLREMFWSFRLLEFLLVAGAIGLVARGRWRGAVVVGWFLAYALIKGTISYASVSDTSLYRFLLPAWPAWVLLVAGVVFCWPIGPDRRTRQRRVDERRSAVLSAPSPRVVVAAAVVLGVGPLALVAAASPVEPGTTAQMAYVGAPVAVVDFGLRARPGPDPHSVILTWNPLRTGRASYIYRVFRGPPPDCEVRSNGAPTCLFNLPLISATQTHTVEDLGARGRVIYRVALAAGPRNDPNSVSDLLLLSKPLAFTAR